MSLNRFNHSQAQDIRELIELPIHHAQTLDKVLTNAISELNTYRDKVADVQRAVIDLPESAIELLAKGALDDSELQVSLDVLTSVYGAIFPQRSLKIKFSSDFVRYLRKSLARNSVETFMSLDNAILAVLVDLMGLNRKFRLAQRVRTHLGLPVHSGNLDQMPRAVVTTDVPSETDPALK